MVVARTNPPPVLNLPPKPLPQPLPGPFEPPVPHCPLPPKPGSFDAKDGNHDGKLNADEFEEGRGLIDKAIDPDKFDRYDTNNDGYVTKIENAVGEFRDAAHRKSQQILPEIIGNTGPKPPKPESLDLSKPQPAPDELPPLPEFKRGEKARPE